MVWTDGSSYDGKCKIIQGPMLSGRNMEKELTSINTSKKRKNLKFIKAAGKMANNMEKEYFISVMKKFMM